MSWKSALYEYVSAANARETEPVAAESLLPAERARLRRLAASYADRGASPLGCDTRLKIHLQREQGREVVVDLELARSTYVRTRGVEHAEHRVDRERVTLSRTPEGEWLVARAEPIVQERHGGGGACGIAASTFLGVSSVLPSWRRRPPCRSPSRRVDAKGDGVRGDDRKDG